MADKTNPRINDVEWERIQELLNGHPFAPQKRHHDSGTPRKTTFELGPGMGSQGRGNSAGGLNEPGDENERNDPRTPRSWYNRDADAQVDDETKPGHGSIQPAPDGSRGDPYATQDLMIENDVFVNDRIEGADTPQTRRRRIKNNVDRLLDSEPVVPHARYNVDRRN
ncbi:hypothetical protein LCGC14_2198730 [marine sediment metagenome]|uniref:Uncharacterized protein n=1 Tax=marine sediment metagenome TaxID=412755 RepID=A0A0F9DHH8_9ZZZZ